jgi:hypothetical protein
VSRSGALVVIDDFNRERERYKIPYGAVITVGDGDGVEAGQQVASWDPHTRPVVTEVAGFLRFEDFVDGVSVHRQTDDTTGHREHRRERSECSAALPGATCARLPVWSTPRARTSASRTRRRRPSISSRLAR